MNILITGGAGFIGSNFISYILNKYPKYKVVNYDKLTYAGNLDNLRDVELNSNYRFVKGDIVDSKRVNEVIKTFGITHIVNFAAESHVDRSILGPQVFIDTNVVGTQVLLDAALKHGIKHFHHVSTDEVFGSLPLDSEEKFNEDTRYDPRSPYSASKAASDHLVRAYSETYGLPVSITNTANNFGPYQNPEKFLSRAITNLIDGKKIPMYGDGKYVRDWLYVEDHCSAIDAVLQNKKKTTYLIGGLTNDINNLEVAQKLLEIFGKDESWIKFVKDRPGHDRRYAIDWSKAKKELGWKPKHNFDTWLVRTVKWYKDNEWWWRPLKEESEKLYEKTGQK
ncbi:dTDP-glucose 4,6-dehydratase [Patescibacteria group bacterium]|nr:dTDP-glucose 4,6-dehydratase [Patescibacteria group bacterium]MBU0776913.1 dTDP-glucose 4,6-dehydratase [Patescibacteria group bacterium]MBU0846292.1 dTDP-glucose 4,6-dehydratase [Patescibacteria group bacterium]MBU0922556.1 dTDP-glucose 4,6-dehydratase [Patescibacteria group bacterium]MBU1845132.1 dTDP-glucose 4,6-dehydratase [Patescibacteria group bacterium]